MKKQNLKANSHLVCIIAAVLFSAVPAFGQLIVQPMRIDLTPSPGRIAKAKFELQNYDLNVTHTVELSLVELTQWEDGTWRIIEPNEDFDTSKLSSCKNWISMGGQKTIEVRPHRIVPVTLSLRVPPGTRGFYGAGITATTTLAPDATGVGVIVRFLVPVLLEIQQGRAQRHGVELQDIGMSFSEPNGTQAAATLVTADIENKGGTFSSLKVFGRIRSFSSGHWREITTTEFRDAGIIPSAKLRLKSNIGRSLPSGKYKIAGALYVDGRLVTPIEKEIDFVGDPTISRAASDVGLAVEPTVATIKAIIPGATRQSRIRVRNLSDEFVNVRTELSLPPGLHGVNFGDLVGDELDCSGWLKLKPETFKLRSGGRQNIGIIAKMPKSENKHACYYALLSMYATYPDGQNAGVKTAYICVTNNNVEPVPAAQPMGTNLAYLEGSKHLVVARFGNFGNTHFTPRCTATITKLSGISMGKKLLSSSSSGAMLPFEFRSFSGVVDFSSYPAETYYVTSTLEYASGEVVTHQIPIRVSIEGKQRAVDIIEPERPGEEAIIELNR